MSVAGTALRLMIWVYQVAISPLFPAHCRYWPTCSVYASQAVARHGALAGGWMALRRILRCHPWGGAGYDPIPQSSCCNDLTNDSEGGLGRRS